MSHTNSTTNYNLPQFVGTDQPAWLTDINGAFSAIDTAVKNASDTATTASGDATTANTSIGTLSNLNTTEKTNLVGAINEVNTTVGTVSVVASDASSNATQALNKANAVSSYLNFTQFKQYVANEITATGATIESIDSLGCACNADGSVGKIYGTVKVNCNNSNGFTITIPSFFRPDSAIAINGVVWANNTTDSNFMITSTLTVNQNGNIVVTKGGGYYNKHVDLQFVACVLFLKDFGDTPVNQ